MIAVILAAGRGTRMGHLTDATPKPMLEVLGKNLIERKLEVLPDEVTKVIITVGYLKEKIMDHFGTSWNGKEIEYVVQETLSGTGGAIKLCKEKLEHEESFLVLMGDDLYNKEDLKEIAANKYSILVSDQGDEGREKMWQVFFDENHMLTKCNENKEEETSPFINAGAYSLGKEYFTEELYQMANGEYSLPNTLVNLINRKRSEGNPLPVKVVIARLWIQITAPESILEAERILSQ